MILQKKLVDNRYSLVTSTQEKKTESFTIPGQGFNLSLAMQQYKKGTLVERVHGFYEKNGFETPDFNQMTKLEQMEALAKYRKIVKEKELLLNQKRKDHVQKLEKERKEKPQGNSDTGVGKPDADRKNGGDTKG